MAAQDLIMKKTNKDEKVPTNQEEEEPSMRTYQPIRTRKTNKDKEVPTNQDEEDKQG